MAFDNESSEKLDLVNSKENKNNIDNVTTNKNSFFNSFGISEISSKTNENHIKTINNNVSSNKNDNNKNYNFSSQVKGKKNSNNKNKINQFLINRQNQSRKKSSPENLILLSNEKNQIRKDSLKLYATEKKIEVKTDLFTSKLNSIQTVNQEYNIIKSSMNNNIKNLDFLSTKTDISHNRNFNNSYATIIENSNYKTYNNSIENLYFKSIQSEYEMNNNKINLENKSFKSESFHTKRENLENLKYSSEKIGVNEFNTNSTVLRKSNIEEVNNLCNLNKNEKIFNENSDNTSISSQKGNNQEENSLDEDILSAKKKYSKSYLCTTKTKKKFDVTNVNQEKISDHYIDNSSLLNLQEAKNFLRSSIISKGKKSSANSQIMDQFHNTNSDISLFNKSGNSIINTKNKSNNNKSHINNNELIIDFNSNNNKIFNEGFFNLKENSNDQTYNNVENMINVDEISHSKKKYTKEICETKLTNKLNNDNYNNILDFKDIDSIYNDNPLNITNEEQEELKIDILKLKDLIDSRSIKKFNEKDLINTQDKFIGYYDKSNQISSYNLSLNSLTKDNNGNESFYCNNNTSISDWENHFNYKFIENRLRNYYNKNKNKFIKKICKSPPDTFRWISWIITAKIPIDRNDDFYNKFLKKELTSEISIQIKKDIYRTFPKSIKKKYFNNMKIDLNLFRILKALAIKDQDVGYCQGMNFIVGFLLIISNFNELESFYMMLSLLNYTGENHFGIRGFFTQDFPLLKLYLFIFQYFFNKKIPTLKSHFDKLDIPDELWISKWLQTLFTIILPYDAVKRVWDCILTNGLDFIIIFSIAYLKYLESDLLKLNETIDIINFFKMLSPQKNEDDYGDLEDLDENSLYYKENEVEKSNNNLNHNINSLSNRNIYLERKNSFDENLNKKFNIEEIIQSAFKLNLKKNKFEMLKKEYEKISKIEINILQAQNLTIKELFEYKITELTNTDDEDNIKDGNINSEFSMDENDNLKYNKEIIDEVKKKIHFYGSESPVKRSNNNINNNSFIIEKKPLEKLDKIQYKKNFSFTKKLPTNNIAGKNEFDLNDNCSECILTSGKKKENNIQLKIFSYDSQKKEIISNPSRFDINRNNIADFTHNFLNEESNPNNLTNNTNASIDEMMIDDVKDNVSSNRKLSFINNIRNSIPSKNIGTIVSKVNPNGLNDNIGFRSSFSESYNNILK